MTKTPDIVNRLLAAASELDELDEDMDLECSGETATMREAAAEITRLRAALAEIEVRTRAYRDDDSWPLVSGIHHVASSALPSPSEAP